MAADSTITAGNHSAQAFPDGPLIPQAPLRRLSWSPNPRVILARAERSMRHEPGHDSGLTHADCMLLAFITFSPSPQTLASLAVDFDFFEREVLTFDRASYGLQRLSAAGLIRVTNVPGDGMTFEPTEAAVALRDVGEANLDLREWAARLGRAVAATGDQQVRIGDSERLPGLMEEDFDAALAPQNAWRDKVSDEFLRRIPPAMRPRDIRER